MPTTLHEIPQEYDKLYQEFLDILTELHNAHISFKNRPVKKAALRIRKAIIKLERFIKPYRHTIMLWEKEYTKELRRILHDDIQRKKQIALERKQKQPQRKKKNDNNSTD